MQELLPQPGNFKYPSVEISQGAKEHPPFTIPLFSLLDLATNPIFPKLLRI